MSYDNTTPFCPKCGKPYVYVGDTHNIVPGQEPWCTCLNDTPVYVGDTHNIVPGIMFANWCVTCWPEKVPAVFIVKGYSVCEKCMTTP